MIIETIEYQPFGFVVAVDGHGWPKTPYGRSLLAFRERERAEEFAAAVEKEDHETCHRLIAAHGTFYDAPSLVTA